MIFRRLFHRPTKREVCVTILKDMARFNVYNPNALRHLDLSILSDEQINEVYQTLTMLRDRYNEAYLQAKKFKSNDVVSAAIQN